jgi:hypothetical protein
MTPLYPLIWPFRCRAEINRKVVGKSSTGKEEIAVGITVVGKKIVSGSGQGIALSNRLGHSRPVPNSHPLDIRHVFCVQEVHCEPEN